MPDNAIKLENSSDHMQLFDATRSRKRSDQSVESGHRSAWWDTIVIALRLGKKLQWDAKAEVFVIEKMPRKQRPARPRNAGSRMRLQFPSFERPGGYWAASRNNGERLCR